MKNSIIFLIGCALYAFLSIATSKKTGIPLSCHENLSSWFFADTSRSGAARLEHNVTFPLLADTIVCKVYDTTRAINWQHVADSICSIVKRDCSKSSFPILVVNAANPNRQSWETWWGKTTLLRTCF